MLIKDLERRLLTDLILFIFILNPIQTGGRVESARADFELLLLFKHNIFLQKFRRFSFQFLANQLRRRKPEVALDFYV